MKYEVTLRRTIIEEKTIEFDWPDGAGRPTSAHVEGYVMLTPAVGPDFAPVSGTQVEVGPWRVERASPAIQPARIVKDGRPKGTRKPKAEATSAPPGMATA